MVYLLFFFTYPFLKLRSLCLDSINRNLHISLPLLYFFMFVAN